MRKNGSPPGVSTESAEEQSFYGRWSRRKQQVRAGQLPAQDPSTVETGHGSAENLPQDVLPRQGEAPETPLLTDADMPPLESLNAESDYSGFMSKGVSEGLRNKALRKLFLSPQFNIVDGLDDYCEDFTSFEPLGDIITSDMRYEREYEAQRALEREQEREQEQEQKREQKLEREQATTAALESDANATGEDRTEQQSTSLGSEASTSPTAGTGAQGEADSNDSDAEVNLAGGEAGIEIDESLTSAAETGGDNQGGAVT